MLVLDSTRNSRDGKLYREFLLWMEKSGIKVYSPLEGILSASLQQTTGL